MARRHCKSATKTAITVHSYYRWRKEYGGLKLELSLPITQVEYENPA
jgi:hypothetical protein